MKEFLLNNYSWLITLVFSVLSILIFLLKKVKVIKKDTAFEQVLSLLPSLIVKAEKSIEGGANKKAFVLSMAISFLSQLTGEDDQQKLCDEYANRISEAIESILLTPVKKGQEDENKK